MKTFPDFTWEWIVDSCEKICEELQNFIESDPSRSHEAQKNYLQSAQGLIAIIPNLREHPHLEKLVPMKSLLALRWFPAKDLEVDLYCVENKVKYSIKVIKGDTDVMEKRVVPFNEVADEVYACISRLREE